MSPERFQQIEAIFHGALEQPASARAGYLEQACGDDAELRAEVESLLTSVDGATGRVRQAIGREAERVGAWDEHAAVGRRLGPYRLVEEIGRGGMGGVFLAVRDDDEYRTEVAIKLLPWGLETPEAIDRFRDERQILATLRHPGIVRLLDGGSEDGVPYLVMDRIRGESITHYADDRDLSVRDRVALMAQVCDAVDYAHQHLVVHRDLKPSNILVTPDGEPKLLDFGIAKLLDPAARGTMAARTRTGIPLLTPEYAAPEQLRGEPVSTATDVHALGAILYELVTGEPLRRFETANLETMIKVVVAAEAPRPSTRCPPARHKVVAGDLDNIIGKALDKDPARRYAGAGPMGADLSRFLDGLPVEARGGGALYRTGKLVRRHLALVAALTMVTLSLITATAVSVWQARRADRQAKRADEAARRARRRFAQVRRLARSLLFEIDGKVAELAGSTAARELIVTRALEYLDALSAEAGDDAGLLEEVAAGYIKIGDIQGSPRTPNLGRSREAVASYRKALAVLDRLGARTDEPPARWLRARAALTAADAERQSGVAAKELLPRARDAMRLVEGLEPTTDEQRVIELLGHLQVYELANAAGDYGEAEARIARLVDRAEAWVGADRSSADARYWLGVALEIRAEFACWKRLEVEDGQRDQARAIALLDEIVAQQPANGKYRRELARALRFDATFHYNDRALIYWAPAGGDAGSAEALMRRALDVYRQLAASDPDDNRVQSELAWATAALGELVALRDPTEAAQLFARARTELAALVSSPYSAYNRGAASCAMVVPLARMGKRELATAAVRTVEATFAGREDQIALRCAHRVAWARAALGDKRRGIRDLEGLVAKVREQIRAYPAATPYRIGLVEILRTLAELDPARRCALLGEALAAWKDWGIAPTAYTRRRAAALAEARHGCPR